MCFGDCWFGREFIIVCVCGCYSFVSPCRPLVDRLWCRDRVLLGPSHTHTILLRVDCRLVVCGWYPFVSHMDSRGLSLSFSFSFYLVVLDWIGWFQFHRGSFLSNAAKISYATTAVEQGVESAVILDGRVPHALLKQVVWSSSSSKNTGGTVITSSSSKDNNNNNKNEE